MLELPIGGRTFAPLRCIFNLYQRTGVPARRAETAGTQAETLYWIPAGIQTTGCGSCRRRESEDASLGILLSLLHCRSGE